VSVLTASERKEDDMPVSRLCTLALPAFPLALLATTFVTPTDSTDNGRQLAAAAAHGPAWIGAALLELLAAALIPFAVVAVARAIRGRGARLASTGAALGFLGTLGMTSIALRHAFVYGLATAERATALHALNRVDDAFGPIVLLLMFCAPVAWIVLAAAAARARIASRLVPVGAFVFFVVDMLPIPAAEELQGVVGLATFGTLAWNLLDARRPAVRETAAPALGAQA
jgi:hypothetical protein